MHVTLPQPVDIVTIDVGWTPQSKVLPNVRRMLDARGRVLTLIKPHYEAPADELVRGVLPDDRVDAVVAGVLNEAMAMGFSVHGTFVSPIRGHGGNREVFAMLSVADGTGGR